jgi:DNA-binding LytR/AlgR family response regulator
MTNSLNVLIVEDNLSFALELEMLLDALNYQVVGRVDNSAAALEMIFGKQPDLILMDIEINGNMSGLEVGRAVAHLGIPILYITALQGSAYEQAGELPGTIGYLVKPVDKITLRTTINLAVTQAATNKNTLKEEDSRDSFVNRDHLFFKKKEVYYKVSFTEIAIIKSNDNYCDVLTISGNIYSLRIPIGKLEEMLPDHVFMRTHRQYIAQTRLIKEVHLNDGTMKVQGKDIPFSRENKHKVEALIK